MLFEGAFNTNLFNCGRGCHRPYQSARDVMESRSIRGGRGRPPGLKGGRKKYRFATLKFEDFYTNIPIDTNRSTLLLLHNGTYSMYFANA